MGVWAKRKEKAKWTIYSTKKPLWNTDTNGIKFGQGLMEKMGWSVGKGLGVNEQGIQEPLRVSYKNDTKGIGFKENDNWSEYQDEFNSLLMELRNSDNSHVVKIPEGEKNEFKSLEEKSKQSRTRVHYQKFTRGKDLSRYSENDLACIIGTSKKKEKSRNEPTVTDNLETSFGVTTINSGSIQDYFKKKWITNQKPNNSACATETAVEHYTIEKACFSLGEEKPEEHENLVSDQNKFSKKHKSNSNLDLLKTNDSSELDKLEKSKKSGKKRKKKETQDVDSEEEPNIKKMKKSDPSNNIHMGEALQENKILLSEVLDNKKKRETLPLQNENEDDSKNHLKSEIFADEENFKYFKIKKRKKNTENYNLQDVNFSNSVNETNQKENSPDVKLLKKKKEKREKQKENEETENQDYSVTSDLPSNDYNKNPCLSIDEINDPNERENTLEIQFNTKKKKKKKKEKSKEIDKILTVHSGDENSEKATEFCLEINLVKKKKRKKEKHREKEKIRDSSNNLNAHSNGEDQKTNIESTLEIESVKKIKKKKEKKNFYANKDGLNVSQNEEFCSKDECTEKANATNDTESVPELITSKKKKRKNKSEKLLENEELPSNFNYGENRETQVEETVNVATAISEVGSIKKKKKKKDKKEKNFSENLTENKIIKSCNRKDSEEKNKFEKSDFEISETLSKNNYNSNINAVNINNNDNINTSNGKIHGNNNDEAEILNAKEEESGMHKHKLELLSEKTIDKFYPGYDTNARVQKLIRWTNIAKFKGSNLGDVSGYGHSKKFQANKSR